MFSVKDGTFEKLLLVGLFTCHVREISVLENILGLRVSLGVEPWHALHHRCISSHNIKTLVVLAVWVTTRRVSCRRAWQW